MGQMRFIVTPSQAATPQVLGQICFAGIDRVGWPAQASVGDGELVLQRSASESGSLLLPWHVKGHGQPILSTACLIERPEPYHLPLELARGTIRFSLGLETCEEDIERAGNLLLAAWEATP